MYKSAIISLICFIAIIAIAQASTGIDFDSDTSSTVTSSQLSCLAQNNQRVIIQAWSGGYGLNTALSTVYSDAISAGLEVDLYAFLCNQCSGNNPVSTAIQQLVSYCQSNSINFGTLWIDVEQCSGCWGSTSSNAAFVTQAVQAASSLGVRVGVYSSLGEWSQTVGSLTALSSFPQWYAHYDNDPSFSDTEFYQYGGWNNPEMKQYAGNTYQCGVSVDLDYYGGSTTTSGSGTTTSATTSGAASSTASGTTSGNSASSSASGTTSGNSASSSASASSASSSGGGTTSGTSGTSASASSSASSSSSATDGSTGTSGTSDSTSATSNPSSTSATSGSSSATDSGSTGRSGTAVSSGSAAASSGSASASSSASATSGSTHNTIGDFPF